MVGLVVADAVGQRDPGLRHDVARVRLRVHEVDGHTGVFQPVVEDPEERGWTAVGGQQGRMRVQDAITREGQQGGG